MKYYTALAILLLILTSCTTTQTSTRIDSEPTPYTERSSVRQERTEGPEGSEAPEQTEVPGREQTKPQSSQPVVKESPDGSTTADPEREESGTRREPDSRTTASGRLADRTPEYADVETGRTPDVPADQLPWVPPDKGMDGSRLTAGRPQLITPQVPELPNRDALVEQAIDRIVASLSTAELVGQLFMPAFVLNQDGLPLIEMDQETQRILRTVQPGGVLLFGQNLRDPEQARRLTTDFQSLSKIPLLIAVDQEGGLVDRLGNSEGMRATRIPSAARVGSTNDQDLAYEVARVIGRELLALGINTNFAPVADVLTNPDNPVIGSRAFGSDPDTVARMVGASVEGYNEVGVLSVLKHFPGHGDTQEDSHYSTAVVYHEMERLQSVELVPFARGIQAGAPAVMTAHISLPNIVEGGKPATFSPAIVHGLLRNQLGFDGLVFTDSLTMGALIGHGPEERWPLMAFEAGADVLVRPRDVERSFQLLVEAVDNGSIPLERVESSVRRILRAKFRLGLMEPSNPGDDSIYRTPDRFFADHYSLGAPEHRAIADEVWIRSGQD